MPPAPPPTNTKDQLEFVLTLLRRSRRYAARGVILAMVVIAGGFFYTIRRPRRYLSETVVLYRETIRTADLVNGMDPGSDARRLGSRLRETLLSRTTLQPIVEEFGLYPRIMKVRGMVDAVDELRNHIAFRSREGDTYQISFESDDKDLAQKVAARLGDWIVDEASRRRTAQAQTLKEFLRSESERFAKDLREKETALAQFLAKNPGFVVPSPTATDITGEAAALSAPGPTALPAPRSSDPLLASLEARASRIERRLRPPGKPTPRTPGTGSATPEDPPEVVEARRDLADKLSHFTDKHPDVVAARARLAQVEAAAAEKQRKAAAKARDAAAAAPDDAGAGPPLDDAQRTALASELSQIRGQMEARKKALAAAGTPVLDGAASTVQLELEYRALKREVEQARERQKQLDLQEFKARLAASSVEDDRNIQVSILDPAFKPTHPIGLGRTPLLGGFILAGLILGLALSVGSAFLDDKVYTPGELALLQLGPVLAIVPDPPPLPKQRGRR